MKAKGVYRGEPMQGSNFAQLCSALGNGRASVRTLKRARPDAIEQTKNEVAVHRREPSVAR
jgi:hypothetical protein